MNDTTSQRSEVRGQRSEEDPHLDPLPLGEENATKRQPTLAQQVEGMSQEHRYQKLKGMLRARNMTVSELAKLATKSSKNWPHVTAVLRGIRKGEKTWGRLEDFLMPDEMIVLGRPTK